MNPFHHSSNQTAVFNVVLQPTLATRVESGWLVVLHHREELKSATTTYGELYAMISLAVLMQELPADSWASMTPVRSS